MQTPQAEHRTVPLVYLAIVGLALSSMLLFSMGGRAEGTPIAGGITYDIALPNTDEGRARYGNIFFAEVVAVAREDRIWASDPNDILLAIIYDVDVQQTLKGNAAGRVQIWYEGFDYQGPEWVSIGKLVVGERYIFFAGYSPANEWYPVNAGLGVKPIRDDKAGADLVAIFTPLIRAVEQLATPVPRVYPCEDPGEPILTVASGKTRAGGKVRLTGENFVRPNVAIWWDGTDIPLVTADVGESCSFYVEVKLPRDDPGTHSIRAEDARGESAEVPIDLTKK